MATARFHRYQLRTTDVDAARAFYADLLGQPFRGDDVAVSRLPERALARGATPHWLGHVGACDVEPMAARIVSLGGQRLGPTEQGAGGARHAALRDPFGSGLAVSSASAEPAHAPVAFHVLHAQDHERAFATYAELFGWKARPDLDLERSLGRHRAFAWDASGATVGAIASTARLPHVHPHWLFFFPVGDLEAALARVRAAGGTASGPTRTLTGVAAGCEDPQGAAFGLSQS